MINFTPRRAAILMCDFDMARVPPEMRKNRRIVVISPKSYNHPGPIVRGVSDPGRCVVVPFSATKPAVLRASHVHIPVGTYRSLTKDVWAICDLIDHVSHTRLDRVAVSTSFLSESLTPSDMARIESGISHALGISRPETP